MSAPEYQDEYYVGKYNLKIRDLYIAYRIARYLWEHPTASEKKAKQYARVAWRRKASGGKRK